MAKLSTHVLDTSRGVPAVGMAIDLHQTAPVQRHLKSTITNDDGRTDEPLLTVLEVGTYELTFHAAGYLQQANPFLSDITVRFTISDPASNYHVPLLLSPFGYSTYRGS